MLHGYETGVIMRSAEGGYSERHLPINDAHAYTLTARDREEVYGPESDVDENGVAAPGTRAQRLRAKLSTLMFADNVQKPTTAEIEAAHHHAEHEHDLQSSLTHPADGHQFDGHNLHDTDEEPLR